MQTKEDTETQKMQKESPDILMDRDLDKDWEYNTEVNQNTRISSRSENCLPDNIMPDAPLGTDFEK